MLAWYKYLQFNLVIKYYLIFTTLSINSLFLFFYLKAESKRGDVAKSIQCYIVREGISEVQAKHCIKELIRYSWKKLNKESAKNSLPRSIVTMSLNMARTAQCIFQHGDGIGTSTGAIKDHLTSLIVKAIPID